MKTKLITLIITATFLSILSLSVAQQTLQTTVQPLQQATIDATMLKKFQTTPSRSTLINTLMSYQASKSILQSAALKTNIPMSELSVRSLDGKMVSVSTTPSFLQNSIKSFNWTAGVKFSMVKNIPMCLDPTGRQRPVGGLLGTFELWAGSFQYRMEDDLFKVCVHDHGSGIVGFSYLYLPSQEGTYMITIQGIVSPPTASTGLVLFDTNIDAYGKFVPIYPLVTGDGVVGISFIRCLPPILPPNGSLYFPYCRMYLTGCSWFSSFTITRL
jgi:hypothetical protein